MPSSTTHSPHTGRVALVTSAARGIGQAIAVGLAERGASVVLGDIGDTGKTVDLIEQNGQRALSVTLDISEPASIEEARDQVRGELGHLDILVNNAGMFESAGRDDLDLALWQRVLSVDLTGPNLVLIDGASRSWRRRLGALPWAVLEELALVALPTQRGWTAPVGVRYIGAAMAITKDTAARAIATLRSAGLIQPARVDREDGPPRSGHLLTLPDGVTLGRGCLPKQGYASLEGRGHPFARRRSLVRGSN